MDHITTNVIKLVSTAIAQTNVFQTPGRDIITKRRDKTLKLCLKKYSTTSKVTMITQTHSGHLYYNLNNFNI